MKSKIFLVAGLFLLAAAIVFSRDQRANLLPKLQPGQTLNYLIRFQSDKKIKTESKVALAMAPSAVQLDAHGLLRVEILDVKASGGKPVVHARARFQIGRAH